MAKVYRTTEWNQFEMHGSRFTLPGNRFPSRIVVDRRADSDTFIA